MAVYLDNAATSHPKPVAVYEAVLKALKEIGASPGRGSHQLARKASELMGKTRRLVAEFLGTPHTDHIFFTKNATEAINVALKGWLRAGDKVLISPMEHNAVLRPLKRLEEDLGIHVDILPANPSGLIDTEQLSARLISNVRLLIVNHASNVTGLLQPVEKIAELCRRNGIPFLLDAAQTAGLQAINCEALGLAMMACSAHKGLLGPPGLGILYIRPGIEVSPLIEGGTGSRSENVRQPLLLPDRYESGTPNLPSIAGLGAGIEYIMSTGIDTIRNHELELTGKLEQGLSVLPDVQIFRPPVRGTGVLSFTVAGMNPGDVSQLLDQAFDIATRPGLHCASLAHQTIGTFPSGTVRISPGFASSDEDIDYFLSAMRSLLAKRKRHIP